MYAAFFVFARIENSGAKYKWTSNFKFSRGFPTNGQLQVELEEENTKVNLLSCRFVWFTFVFTTFLHNKCKYSEASRGVITLIQSYLQE